MAHISPKPPEVLQAQVAAFAAEQVIDYTDKGHIFEDLGALATGAVNDITRVIREDEYIRNETGGRDRVPAGTVWPVASAEDYTKFLRLSGGSRYESISGRADLLAAYKAFEPEVTKLREELADPATRNQHPNYLGKGANAMVFSLAVEGKDYAVRVPHGARVHPAAIDSHMAAAVLSRGIPHLEQIVAASHEDGVTVAEKMPGKEVGRLTPDEIAGVTDAQLADLVDTLMAASAKGIEIDPKPSNFFYDTQQGYGIVDLGVAREAGKNSADQTLGGIVGWMATPLENAGRYGKPHVSLAETTAEHYEEVVTYAKVNFDVITRYRAIVEAKLSGKDLLEALEPLDDRLQSLHEIVSNPNWIPERLEDDKKYAEMMRASANLGAGFIGDWID